MTTADEKTLCAALAQFNAGAYFACHETLEGLWLRDETPQRAFYQGLIQIAAAFVHVGRGNHRGIVPLLDAGLAKLAAFPDVCHGLDLRSLRQDAEAVRELIASEGALGLRALQTSGLPTIHLISEPTEA